MSLLWTIFLANIMPWSSPCKCPAHIAYGRAIGIETLKAGYRISHQCTVWTYTLKEHHTLWYIMRVPVLLFVFGKKIQWGTFIVSKPKMYSKLSFTFLQSNDCLKLFYTVVISDSIISPLYSYSISVLLMFFEVCSSLYRLSWVRILPTL